MPTSKVQVISLNQKNPLIFRNLLEKLGINARYNSGVFKCSCPVHDGDNPTGFSMYNNTGVWTCWTHGCQDKWGKSARGLIAAMLDKNGIPMSVDQFLKSEELYLDDVIREEGIKSIKYDSVVMSREEYLEKVKIPCKYYLNRGFKENTLSKFDIGTYTSSKNKMLKGSAIIPVYNNSYTGIIAYSARKNTTNKNFRWHHMKGSWRSNCLYNSWFAKAYIKASKTAILCEGPAKVWRLEEAGYNNALAIFGTKFSKGQQTVLSSCGPENVIIMMDNDGPGKEAASNIAKSLKGLYNIIIPKVSFTDLDDASPTEIKRDLEGQI